MGGFADSYDPYRYDPGGSAKIFSPYLIQPDRTIDPDPGQPPDLRVLLGLAALGLGYWATRKALSPPAVGVPPASGPEERNKATLQGQRRVSGLADEINGGPGSIVENYSSTGNRAAQLAGLPNGGLTLGRQTLFPSIDPRNSGGLIAGFHGADAPPKQELPSWLAHSTNDGTGDWQALESPSRFDDLDIPDFLRRNKESGADSAVAPEKQGIEPAGSRLGGGGGQGHGGGGGGGGGNERKDEDDGRNECLERWLDEFYDYCEQFRPWGTRYRDACRERAGNRLTLCYSNNRTPDPREPPKYSWSDMPRNPPGRSRR